RGVVERRAGRAGARYLRGAALARRPARRSPHRHSARWAACSARAPKNAPASRAAAPLRTASRIARYHAAIILPTSSLSRASTAVESGTNEKSEQGTQSVTLLKNSRMKVIESVE